MHSDVTQSRLPSFLFSCPPYGSRLVAAPRYIDGDDLNDLKDVAYACVQCGKALITTMRQLPRHCLMT
jgi:hypothetical protein